MFHFTLCFFLLCYNISCPSPTVEHIVKTYRSVWPLTKSPAGSEKEDNQRMLLPDLGLDLVHFAERPVTEQKSRLQTGLRAFINLCLTLLS